MTATLLSACGGGDDKGKDNNTQDETTTPADDNQGDEQTPADAGEPAEVTPEELPEAFAHITFDEGAGENYVAVTQVEDKGDADGGTYGIAETEATLAYADGPSPPPHAESRVAVIAVHRRIAANFFFILFFLPLNIPVIS